MRITVSGSRLFCLLFGPSLAGSLGVLNSKPESWFRAPQVRPHPARCFARRQVDAMIPSNRAFTS